MVGLGGQEILLLACCAVVPVGVGLLVLLIVRGQAKAPARDRADDEYEPDDSD